MAAPRIAVVDYHKGNLLSVARSLSDAGADARVTDQPADILAADAVVVPGVGAFEDCMAYLRASGEGEAIVRAAADGVPFLGICLGLHVLFERGDERSDGSSGAWVAGLGVLAGSVTRLESGRLKVPHVGWDQLHLTSHGRACPLYAGIAEGANVYFTHSYALADDVDDGVVTTRSHYTRSFASGVWADNVFGVQFHPEKSSATGLAILRNFVAVAKACQGGYGALPKGTVPKGAQSAPLGTVPFGSADREGAEPTGTVPNGEPRRGEPLGTVPVGDAGGESMGTVPVGDAAPAPAPRKEASA